MTVEYLKKAPRSVEMQSKMMCVDPCKAMLDAIEAGGDETAMKYARELDKWDGSPQISDEEIEQAQSLVSERLRSDIQFAHDNIRRFAAGAKSNDQ